MSTIQETLSRAALVNELTEKFNPVADHLIFGSLIYPSIRVSHQVNIHADAAHFLQRVLRKCPKRIWGDPQLKRFFVMEKNHEAGRHIHFLFEIPKGMSCDEFCALCGEQWMKIALRERRALEYWKRLNCGTRISLLEKRTILIKNGVIVRQNVPLRVERDTTTKRPLVKISLVDSLRKSVGYCLKLDGIESQFESGDVLLDDTSVSFIKGHSPALSLW